MIFYFSGTGNTLSVAKRIAEATDERLIAIADAIKEKKYSYQIQDGERIGFCFPIHGWRPPFIVRDFIKQLHIAGANGHYVYAFATCGDDVGLTFNYLRQDLQIAGLPLDSCFSVIMPESYMFPLIDVIDKPEKAKEKRTEGLKKADKYIPYIINKETGLQLINESHWPRTNSIVIGGYFVKHWVTDSKFSVDADLCARCGKCAKVCPVQNIAAPAGELPEWQHNGLCTTCFACYHHCPKHAINFGHRTKGKRQMYFE